MEKVRKNARLPAQLRGRLGMTVPSVMIADLGGLRAADAAIGPVMHMSERWH
jgi:hypothetical protein